MNDLYTFNNSFYIFKERADVTMLEDPLDDDTHLCIKCNLAIVGLEQYIRHRKSNCASSSSTSQNHIRPISKPSDQSNDPNQEYSMHDHAYGMADKDHHSPMHSFDYDLGADFFFSSLELQSSTKKPPGTGGKTSSNVVGGVGKTMPRENSPCDKLMNAITEISGPKRIHPNDLHYFEDDDCESPEEEQNDEDPDQFDTDPEEYGDAPPRNHTGGKWKPENRPSSTLFRGWERAWDDDRLDKSFDDNMFEDENPPPSHTKGKWVPGSRITKLDYDKPEVVPLSTQYWCNSCNRGLASKIVYERHLKSNTHIKKLQDEKDLETVVCPVIEKKPSSVGKRIQKTNFYNTESMNQSDSDTSNSKQKRIRGKYFTNCDICKKRIPIKLFGKHLISHYHYRRMQQSPKNAYNSILENIDKIVLQSPFQCAPCKFYTNTQENFFMHWNSKSHFDHINSGESGKFLCNCCKFETKDYSIMSNHLTGLDHQDIVISLNRSVPIIIQKLTEILCPACKQEFRFNIELNKHMINCDNSWKNYEFKCNMCEKNCKTRAALAQHLARDHPESVGSKKFFCSVCKENFATPEEARRHRRTTEHRVKSARLRGLDKEGALMKKCQICNETGFKDVLILKEHIREIHPNVKYSCPHCAANFVLPQELSRHVRDKNCNFFTNLSSSTQQNTDSNQTATGNEKGGALGIISSNTTTLVVIVDDEADETDDGDNAICEQQSYFTMTASISGTSNDNGIYVDEIDASIANTITPTTATQLTETLWKCKLCTFGTESRAEFIHHKILHNMPYVKPTDKLECPFCKRSYVKASLRHLLSDHIKSHQATSHQKQFKCIFDSCSFVTTSNFELKSHQTSHHQLNSVKFQCNYTNCHYEGKSMQLLKRHIESHNPPKKLYSCVECDFETRHSGHLKRHLKVHDTNEDKYLHCPHCDYRCNIMDNLRKHVIKTAKHVGRYLYECRDCNTGTNSTMDFKDHLSSFHGQMNVDLSDYFINKRQM
uniref:CSON007954 protein n=1 Tax=Culicoides sonorensis TaxID=179676 RepID=A0A336LGN2_CULSO